MSCPQYPATFAYVESLSAAPEGVELLHDSDIPADVQAELNAAGINLGGFLKFIPLLLAAFQNPQLQELLRAFLDAIKGQ